MFYLDAHCISFLTEKYVSTFKRENTKQDLKLSSF